MGPVPVTCFVPAERDDSASRYARELETAGVRRRTNERHIGISSMKLARRHWVKVIGMPVGGNHDICLGP